MKKLVFAAAFLLLMSLNCLSYAQDAKDKIIYQVTKLTSLTQEKGEEIYFLRKGDSDAFGLFINNRRVISNQIHEIKLDDVIMVERPTDLNCRWFVNNQYIATGNIISFIPRDFVYSANNNEFIITWESDNYQEINSYYFENRFSFLTKRESRYIN